MEIVSQKNGLEKAVAVLKKGGIIVFPTETSYGIGADALNKKAVAKVHKAKKQREEKPISVVVADLEQAEKIAEIDKNAEKIIHKFMPGPLTLICKQKEIVPENLTTNGIAFRIPGNKFAKALAKKFGGAVTATSANLHGKPAIYSAKKAVAELGKHVDLIVDAGELSKKEASTIYCSINNKLFREGQIKKEEIEKLLGKKVVVA